MILMFSVVHRKPNIFDNMLAIMEKHATNLEAIVAERTEQLSEEKKMTENLLLRMLPRYVPWYGIIAYYLCFPKTVR